MKWLPFLVLAAVWLIFSCLLFYGIINRPFVQLINPPGRISSLSDVKGPDSWSELLVLITFPRLVYSFVFALGISFLFSKLINKSLLRDKRKKVIFSMVITLIFLTIIFPRKIFAIRVIPPPETKMAVFKYAQGQCMDIGCSWQPDNSRALFFTNAQIEEIYEYQSKNEVVVDRIDTLRFNSPTKYRVSVRRR